MSVKYEVKEEKTGNIVIEANTNHCFTNRELRPINLKKYNEEFYNKFTGLAEEK